MRVMLLALLLAAPAWAEFRATIEANEEELGTEDLLEVTVTVVDPPPGVVIAWEPGPDFIHSKRFTSNSTKQGSHSETRSFRPTRAGAITFPALEITTPLGSKLTTAPVNVKVIEGHVSTAKREKSPESLKPPPLKLPPKAEGLFVRATLGPSSSTLGDPLDLSLRLFVRADLPISNIDQILFELPENVVIEELPVPTMGNTETIDGVEFRAIELRAARVLPLTLGSFSVTPSARVTMGRDAALLTADPLSVDVKPASDPRRSFTKEEGVALLQHKASLRSKMLGLQRPERPVSAIKSVKFKP